MTNDTKIVEQVMDMTFGIEMLETTKYIIPPPPPKKNQDGPI
jgi:hypothetical protein